MPLRPAGLLLSASGPSVHSLPPVLPRPLGHNQRGEGGHGRPWSLGLVLRTPALSSCSRACRAVCHLTRAILAAALGAVLDLLHFQGGSRGQEGALLEPGPRDPGVAPRGCWFWGSSQQPPLPLLTGGVGRAGILVQESGIAPQVARGCHSGPRSSQSPITRLGTLPGGSLCSKERRAAQVGVGDWLRPVCANAAPQV